MSQGGQGASADLCTEPSGTQVGPGEWDIGHAKSSGQEDTECAGGTRDSEKKNLFACILSATNPSKYASAPWSRGEEKAVLFCESGTVSGTRLTYPLLLI